MRFMYIFFASIVLLASTGCAISKDPYAAVKDERAKVILQQAISAYGGLDNWNKLNYISFDKWYALYEEDGTEEVNVNQNHHYTPEKIYMTWNDNGDKIEQTKIQDTYTKKRNGKPDTGTKASSIKNSILASTFVVNVPFNLLDSGSDISYEGESTFNGKAVHVIKIAYSPRTQKHHTTEDIWWHYFDKESYISQGYKVKHLDHISLVENQKFTTLNGYTLPTERESFRVDDNEEKLYLRAKYIYSNYKISQ